MNMSECVAFAGYTYTLQHGVGFSTIYRANERGKEEFIDVVVADKKVAEHLTAFCNAAGRLAICNYNKPKEIPTVFLKVTSEELEASSIGPHVMAIEVCRKDGATARFHISLYYREGRVSCQVRSHSRDKDHDKSVCGHFVKWDDDSD